jgi:predicted nucleotidyltransferase
VIDLTPFKAEINELCQELSLQRLDLIGSATREDFSAESDIDVLLTFAGDENLFERFFSLQSRL